VYGLPPLGCLPAEITFSGRVGQLEVGCEEDLNQIAIAHNMQLLTAFSRWKSDLPGIRILYGDAYTYLYDAFNNPSKYGNHHIWHPFTQNTVFFSKCVFMFFLIDTLLSKELVFD